MIGLTAKQLATLRFVAGFMEAHERAPTLKEIQRGLSFGHPPRAFHMLRRLVERGAISRHGRSIQVLIAVAIPRAPDGAPLYFVRIQS